jgi:EF hand
MRLKATGLPAGLFVAAAVVASPAVAQQPGMVIAFLDKNADGKCDLNEYLTFQLPRLAQFDADGDGGLNLGEFRASLQGKSKMNAAFVFKNANAEGGRTLSQKEFLGYHAWVFKEYVDSDKDGFMSAEEWSAIMAAAG